MHGYYAENFGDMALIYFETSFETYIQIMEVNSFLWG